MLSHVHDSAATPSKAIASREPHERFETVYERLPEAERWLIKEARVLERSHSELATELGISEGALRARLFRAVARLGAELEDDLDKG